MVALYLRANCLYRKGSDKENAMTTSASKMLKKKLANKTD